MRNNAKISRVPLCLLERFTQEIAERLRKDKTLTEKVHRCAIVYLAQGRISKYFEGYRMFEQLNDSITEYRDREIGKNLEKAEEEIRGRYPHLSKRELSLVLTMGAEHAPEKYTTHTIQVIDLSGDAEYIPRVYGAKRKGLRGEELDEVILREEARILKDRGLRRIEMDEIYQMPYTDLVRRLSRQ